MTTKGTFNLNFYLCLALAAAGCLADSLCAQTGGNRMVWEGNQWVQAKPPKPGSPEGDLVDIRALVEEGRNKQAVKAVDKFLLAHAASAICEEAMNLAGQALVSNGRYWDAYGWYERQITNYPSGAYFERALDREYLIADAFIGGRKRRALKILKVSAQEDGIEILMRIAAHAPGSDLAERALLRVADYHFDRQEYPEAIAVYDEFVKSNPHSKRRAYAMLRAAKASLLSFRGVKWDTAPLLDAAVRFRVFAQAYPKAGEKENAVGILSEIRQTLAHKAFHSGTFYERTGHRPSAVFYYRKVVREYSDSPWAQQARQKLDSMGPIKLDPKFTPHIARKKTPPESQAGATKSHEKKPKSLSAKMKQKPSKKTDPIRLEELTN